MYLPIGSLTAQSLIILYSIDTSIYGQKECLVEKGNIVFICHIWALNVPWLLYFLCLCMYLNVYS